MIDELKKYLVIGTFESANLSRISDSKWVPAKIGPYAEEVWATDEKMAKQEWLRKVLPHDAYYQNFEIEVRQLYGLNLFMKEE